MRHRVQEILPSSRCAPTSSRNTKMPPAVGGIVIPGVASRGHLTVACCRTQPKKHNGVTIIPHQLEVLSS